MEVLSYNRMFKQNSSATITELMIIKCSDPYYVRTLCWASHTTTMANLNAKNQQLTAYLRITKLLDDPRY